MAIMVKIPTPLLNLTGGRAEIEVEGATISEIINSLELKSPGIKGRLYDEKNTLRRFINIYINEEDIRFISGEDSQVKDGDRISIIPAIAGGVE